MFLAAKAKYNNWLDNLFEDKLHRDKKNVLENYRSLTFSLAKQTFELHTKSLTNSDILTLL